MRVSEGVPRGRVAEVYHPELFQEHEETGDEWFCCYRFPFEEVVEDWDPTDWDPDEGPVLLTSAENGFVTFGAPFGCTPQAVKTHIEEIVEIVSDHGLSFRIHTHDPERTTLDLSYRIYTSGLNSNVIQCAIEALYECNMSLVDLLQDDLQDFPPPRRRRLS